MNGNIIVLSSKYHKKLSVATQPKWYVDNYWYKADDPNYGYEGLAESIVSDMLDMSNIGEHARYDPVVIDYDGEIMFGCVSENFLKDKQRLVEVGRISKAYNLSPTENYELGYDESIQESMRKFVNDISEKTGVQDFDKYFTKIIQLDAITLNPDRHFGNFCLIRTKESVFSKPVYTCAPIFDNGRALALQDSYWENAGNLEDVIRRVSARPFSMYFSTQAKEAVEMAGGSQLRLTYSLSDLKRSLDRCREIYPESIIRRADSVMTYQILQNPDLFFGEERKEFIKSMEKEVMPVICKDWVRDEHADDFVVHSKKHNHLTMIAVPSGDPVVLENGKELDFAELSKYGSVLFSDFKALSSSAQRFRVHPEKEHNVINIEKER